MSTPSHVSPNNIYLLKEELNYQQLSSAINRCLCQAEALAIIATIADAETVGVDTVNNYLWALSDMIQEVRWLYEHFINKY